MSDPAAAPPPAPPAPAPAPAATPAPAPPPQVAAPAPAPRQPPADWQGPASAWNEMQSAREAKRAAVEQANAATAALEAYKSEASTRLSAAEQRAKQIQDQYDRDIAIVGRNDLPDTFKHPRMRERLWGEYQGHRAAKGDDALSFGDFLASDELKTDPLYAAHFQTAPDPHAIPTLPPAPAPAHAPPAPQTGTVPPPVGQPVQYTQQMVSRLKQQGLYRAGRIDRATGKPVGGSPHWQAHMRTLGAS